MDFNQGILDIIGAFIGFISIILLLSVLVTSLVQAFQSSLRLRARNLKKGLQSINATPWQLDSKTSGDFALKALNPKHICILGRKSDPTTTVSRLIGPATPPSIRHYLSYQRWRVLQEWCSVINSIVSEAGASADDEQRRACDNAAACSGGKPLKEMAGAMAASIPQGHPLRELMSIGSRT